MNEAPFWNSRNKGGSPRGDNRPPQLATMAIKKSTVCILYLRCEMVCNTKRINSMAAPVVPMNEANSQPIPRITVLVAGFATRSPLIQIPPVVTNSAIRSKMKGT